MEYKQKFLFKTIKNIYNYKNIEEVKEFINEVSRKPSKILIKKKKMFFKKTI